jgi:Fe2+ transport system protein B
MIAKKGLTESPKIPLKSMVSIANQTIGKYVDSLDESTKKEVFHILATKNEDLENEFANLKESAVNKLKVILSKQEEVDLKTKITETIEKIENEKFDQVNYVKLKRLEESILLDS